MFHHVVMLFMRHVGQSKLNFLIISVIIHVQTDKILISLVQRNESNWFENTFVRPRCKTKKLFFSLFLTDISFLSEIRRSVK